jgi:hypothetical protein
LSVAADSIDLPIAAAPPRWQAGAKFANWAVACQVFLGGFVIIEPSPYEFFLALVLIVWAAFGLKLNRYFMPMTALMIAYIAGGFLSFTQLDDFSKPMIYMATTIFLVASAVFFAAAIVEDPQKRLEIIRRAYIASAVIVSLIGILAYFEFLPGSEFFKGYDRAKGTFQDPNVFGPFLVLPATTLARDILTRRLRDGLARILWLLIILAAIFLSFSRAAWGMVACTMLGVAYLAYITEKRQLARFRIVAYLAGGSVAIGVLIAAAISVPAVQNLWVQRAEIVQSYDGGHLGRFDRQAIGFFAVQEKPFGFGPFQFGITYGEDEHNMWLKGFTVYGWLGGFAYIVLVIWTLAAATPLLFKPRPWLPFIQCTYAVFIGQLFIHNVIDNDHWRHLFMIYGVLWGAIAADKMYTRAGRRGAASGTRAQVLVR